MSWDDAPVIDSNDGTASDTPDVRLLLLQETGFEALTGWCAKPVLARTHWSQPLQSRVVLVTTQPDGSETRGERPFTAADQRMVDDAIDEYLADAQIPARPRGFLWYVRLPARYPTGDAFWVAVNTHLDATAPDSTHPLQIRDALERIIPHLLGTSSSPDEPT